MRLSFADCFGEAMAFVRREASLLLPLTFALMGVGLFANAQAQSALLRQGFDSAWCAIFIMALAITGVGSLATRALVLVPQLSVREALAIAARRVPSLLAIRLPLIALELIAILPFMAGRGDGATQEGQGGAAILGLVGYLAYLFLSGRMFCFAAVLAERDVPLRDAVTLSWRLTGRDQFKLMGLLFWFEILAGVVGLIAGRTLMFALAPLETMLAETGMALMLGSFAAAMAGALLNLLMAVFSAFYFRKLDSAQ